MRNMSNDIKRFAVAVLAACGLSVSVAQAESSYQANFLADGESSSSEIASPSGISDVTVVECGDNFVDLRATLTGLGENVSIQLAYGFDETSLVKTQEVVTAEVSSEMTLRLNRLLPQSVYCVRVVAVNDQGVLAVSDPVHVKTAVSPDGFGEPGLNQTFFRQANAKWDKSYAELPQGDNWLNYQDNNRIYRRELGVLAAYLGSYPKSTSRKSEVWGDEVYWPENGGQWVYWGQMHLEGGKSYRFRTNIDDNERVQITDPSTGLTTTLIEDVNSKSNIFTSDPYVPTETGWYPIEIRLSDGSGGAGGYTTTDDRLNTFNMGWSDDDGTNWNLMMDEGDGSLFMTGDSESVSVEEVVSDGALQRLDLTFPAASGPRDLLVVWGPVHGGNTLAGWANTNRVATIEAGQTEATYSLPTNWGSANNLVLRFCLLDGARPVWSPSVYWRDYSEPLITELSLDGRGGDTLKVTGSVSFAGSSCTLKVLVGRTPEALDQVWTELPGIDLQDPDPFALTEPGPFALTLFEDTESPKYLAPGETYYVCVEATAGGSVSRSQVMQVKMAQADMIGSAKASVSRLTGTFTGVLAGCGMGESAKVSLWVGEENDEESLQQVGGPLDVSGGEFEFTYDLPEFERTYYWQFRAVSTSAGDTAVATTRTDVATCRALDTATYTWNGGTDGEWETPENWKIISGDGLGYPNGTKTTVQFLADTKARIVLRGEMSVGNLWLNQEGIEVTFTHAAGQAVENAKPKLSVNTGLLLNGARLRLVLDGVAFQSPNGNLDAFDGEVRLSNGASWVLGGLGHTKGARLWLDPGTTLSCSDFLFGGGLMVIDDATFTMSGCAHLGSGDIDGGKIRFAGKQPVFRCSGQGAVLRSERETANVRLEFAVPVGGYETPPFVNAHANPGYILGHKWGEERLWPITVDIASDSPAAIGLQKTNTTLISWGKGICPKIIQTAAQPGANATFVWSGGDDAHPVSLGVRLVPTGFIIRVR